MNKSTKSLILNVIFPSLLIGGIAGTFVGYLLAKDGQVPLEAQIAAKNRTMASEAEAKASPDATPAQDLEAGNEKAKGPEVQIGGATRADDGVPTGNYATPSPEQLEKMGDKNWVQGTVQSREADEKNREVNTVETLPDGARADRTYREDGSLKGESVTYGDGTNLSRNFFESGGVKVAYVKRTDGSATSVTYDSTGVPTQEATQYPDGTQIYKEFDDHGKPTGAYQVSKDGGTTSLDSPSEVAPSDESAVEENSED